MQTTLQDIASLIDEADALVIGAGAGLSASAGLTYSGERFEKHFADMIARYHLRDMYSAGFYPFPSLAEKWAYWSRHILLNRYEPLTTKVYDNLLKLVADKDYFVLTTNVDHCFQRSGFDKNRLFYTQGDYGLWQCSVPCHEQTYDNEATVRRMVAEQKDGKVPEALIPYCPRCGAPMVNNLRADDTFVEDEGWYAASKRFMRFIESHREGAVCYLELGVGFNTPGIIKYRFWQLTQANPEAHYICINRDQVTLPDVLGAQAQGLAMDIGQAIEALLEQRH